MTNSIKSVIFSLPHHPLKQEKSINEWMLIRIISVGIEYFMHCCDCNWYNLMEDAWYCTMYTKSLARYERKLLPPHEILGPKTDLVCILYSFSSIIVSYLYYKCFNAPPSPKWSDDHAQFTCWIQSIVQVHLCIRTYIRNKWHVPSSPRFPHHLRVSMHTRNPHHYQLVARIIECFILWCVSKFRMCIPTGMDALKQ